jgi:hypothetical protein
MQERLLDHRRILRAELRRARALPSMRKVPDDPSWADLWDAFGCAFVATCEAHGAAVHIGHDRQKLHVEGAVIAPQTRIPTRTPR